MIPTIGMMIGAYIALRCLEVSVRAESHFINEFWRIVVIMVAILVFLLTGFLTFDLVLTGARSGSGLGLP